MRRCLPAADRPARLDDLALEPQGVARLDHALELAGVDAGEEGELAAVLLLDEDGHGAGLRHRLDRQHTGHHRSIGEVAREPPVVLAQPALRHHAPPRLQHQHLVDEEERLPVRDDLLDLLPAERR